MANSFAIEARITLLESRGPHNYRIVNKLRRQLRKIRGQN